MSEREWNPIESAPKDGTWLLLWPSMYPNRTPTIGFWADLYGKCWYDKTVGHLNGEWKPTHWMPLPEPPRTDP